MQLENGGITEQWNPTLSFPLLHLHETFGFHSSDSTVCRIVTQQLKHKPSADSKALHFCCRPAQHSFIPSRLCFERSGIWSQLARQIHFWQYAILPVWLTQNNSPQKAISTFTIQKSKPSIGRITQKWNFLHLIQCSLKQPSSALRDHACVCYVQLDGVFLSLFLFCASCRPCKNPCYCPWQSDHCCRDWNGTVVGWSSPSHMLPVAATWPLTQAHGLIRSQRIGQWLLPHLREVFLRGLCNGQRGEAKMFSSNLSL